MSKPSKSSNLIYILLGVTVVAAAWLNMGGDPPKKTKITPPKPAASKTGNTSAMKTEVTLVDEDTTKTFPAFTDKLKGSFKPIIARNAAETASAGPSNQIPTSFADGESNWIYTGSATVDGKIQGLVENTSTGEGAFLSPGQHWKKLVCNAIRDDGLEVTGPDGDVRTIYLLTEPKDSENVAPLNPSGLTGAIDVLPDPAAAAPSGGGGRRGRRNQGGAPATDPTAAGADTGQ